MGIIKSVDWCILCGVLTIVLTTWHSLPTARQLFYQWCAESSRKTNCLEAFGKTAIARRLTRLWWRIAWDSNWCIASLQRKGTQRSCKSQPTPRSFEPTEMGYYLPCRFCGSCLGSEPPLLDDSLAGCQNSPLTVTTQLHDHELSLSSSDRSSWDIHKSSKEQKELFQLALTVFFTHDPYRKDVWIIKQREQAGIGGSAQFVYKTQQILDR